jgi:hypothetical protein
MQTLAAQRQATYDTRCPGYVSIASGLKEVCKDNGKFVYQGAYGPIEAVPVPGETVNGKQKFTRKVSGGRRKSRRGRKARKTRKA